MGSLGEMFKFKETRSCHSNRPNLIDVMCRTITHLEVYLEEFRANY